MVPSRAVVKPHANDYEDDAVPEKHHRDNDCDDDDDDGLRAKSTSTPTHTHTEDIIIECNRVYHNIISAAD